jgi:uncharacterized membrane protein/mono/diheme cytochrome c family protein
MEENSWIWIVQLLGRLHPLAVHFPIGLLVVALLLEILTIKGKRKGLREGIAWMVYLGAIFSVVSTCLGWFLGTFDNYTGDLVSLHQYMGVSTAILASITALILYKLSKTTKPNYFKYRSGLFLTVIVLSVTGHLGASLTHGEDFLTSVLPRNMESYDDGKTVALLTQLTPLDTLSESQKDALNLEVRAIFAHNCYQCHNENKQKGGLVLDNKRGVFKGGKSGESIVAGYSNQSELYRRITLSPNHDEVMPKKGKVLKDSEIELIRLWIEEGAHWADQALKIFPEAPLALEKPILPKGTLETHPVDKLVFSYFDKNKIKVSGVVDDRTFIRRAYLDVLGLLPSIAKVESFINDNSSDKREDLIDNLLSDTTNYTQNWLSFWNDLLRNDYSGTGFIAGGRKQITRWLYKSLMDNKPYNLMVKELMNPTEESIGFIKGIQWRGVVNASQRTEMQAAQNIGQALLGMNVKCASCHNSFVSNLTLDQAYGFATVFSDSILELNRCDKPIGKMAKVNFLYPSLGSVDGTTVAERLEKLSEVMVKPENGRLYRTITNRIWKRLMGRGIVEPVDEMDKMPWDADLLDWLSADFIDSGYDLKQLMKTVMTSKTYQLPTVKYEEVAIVKSASYKFKGPLIRRMSAEQFSDAVSQVISPVYYATEFNPAPSQLVLNRIWHREKKFDRDVLPEPGTRYFRHIFELDTDALESAQVLISVDNSYSLFINGKEVLSGTNWKKVGKKDIKEFLKKGENIIAIEGENIGSIPKPAGVLFALKIIDKTGKETFIKSDKNWKSTADKPTIEWLALEFDDSKWSDSKNFGSGHWGKLLDFSFNNNEAVFARASMVKQHTFLKALGRPSRENIVTSRDDQATLLQALELTNGTYFNSVLEEGANEWLSKYNEDSEKIVDTLYHQALGRVPSTKEKKIMLQALGEEPNIEAVQDLFWATLLLPEFQFIY